MSDTDSKLSSQFGRGTESGTLALPTCSGQGEPLKQVEEWPCHFSTKLKECIGD